MKKTILFLVFLFTFASALPAAEETLQSKQIASCDRIGYPEWRDDCYESLGSSALDYTVCVKFTNKDRRDACISSHPPHSADDCLLNKSDKKAQGACLESFGQSPKTHLNQTASKPASQPPARKIDQRTARKQNPDKAAKLQRAREEKQAHALEKAIKLQTAKEARDAKAQEKAAKIQAEKSEQEQLKAAKIQKAKNEKEAKTQAVAAKLQAAKDARDAKAQERAAKRQAEKDAQAAKAHEAAAKIQAAKDAKAQQKAERIQKEREAREAKAQKKINKTQQELSTPVSVDSVNEKTEAVVQPVIVQETPIEAPQPIIEQNSTESAADQRGEETAQKVPAEEPPMKTKIQEKTEKLQKAKAEREARAKEKADKLKAAKEAAAKEKAEKLQKIKDDKEAAARKKAEKLQKAKEERDAAGKPQTKVTSDDKSPLKPGETFNTNTTGLELKLGGFRCTIGFGSWTEPPLNKKDEISCDKENVKQFSTLLNRCMAADHDVNILSFDMNKDGCVTCADLRIWQKQVNKLFGEKKRSTDGRNLKLKECLERKF